MAKRRHLLIWLVALLLTASPAPALTNILTNIGNQYQAASAGWMTTALGFALHLFYLLVTAEIAWSAIYYLFHKDSLADFLAALLLKLLALLFFWVLIQEAPTWIPTIIHSFTQAGAAIGGTQTLDPSSVFDQGVSVATTMLNSINDASLFTAFLLIVVAGLSALGVVLAYAVLAAQLLITLVESYLVIGGGVLMLGFAGSRWTLVFTERYFGYVVSVGIKLFVLYLIIGLGGTLAPQWAAVFTTAQGAAVPQPQAYLDVVGGALVFMCVGWQVPALASSLLLGAPSLTLGGTATTTAMLTAAMTNAVAKSLQTTVSTTKQTADAVASATKLAQAAKIGLGEERRGGAEMPTALGRTASDISRAAGQQFRDSVLRGTGRESAAAAEQAAGAQAVRGWGRGTPLGNLTNRVHANRIAAESAASTGSMPTTSGSSGSASDSGDTAAGQQSPAPPPPKQPINTITPPPIPHDGGHGGITIRFNLPE
jgi:type IV secretion system protein TrbL